MISGRARCATIAREGETYRAVRVYQPEGAHHWEIEGAHQPTGERFTLDNEWAWAERLRRDAGY